MTPSSAGGPRSRVVHFLGATGDRRDDELAAALNAQGIEVQRAHVCAQVDEQVGEAALLHVRASAFDGPNGAIAPAGDLISCLLACRLRSAALVLDWPLSLGWPREQSALLASLASRRLRGGAWPGEGAGGTRESATVRVPALTPSSWPLEGDAASARARRLLGLPVDALGLHATADGCRAGDLIEIVDALAADHAGTMRVAVVGSMRDLALEGALRAAAGRIAPGSVRVVLGLEEQDIDAWLCAADVAVFPAGMVTPPWAATRALSMGVPVLAPRTGGWLDFIEPDVTGWLYEKGEGLRSALDRLRDRRLMTRAEVQRAAAMLRPKRVAAAMIQVYRDALAERWTP